MATIVVEDGTGKTDANSYVTEAELTTYATDRGVTLTGSTNVLLIKSMDYFESLNFQGKKTNETQALQWPRTGVVIDGYSVESSTVPQEVKNAQMAIAVSIDQSVDPLSDIEPGIKREKVGEIEVEYQDGAGTTTFSRSIQAALNKLVVGAGGGSFYVARA